MRKSPLNFPVASSISLFFFAFLVFAPPAPLPCSPAAPMRAPRAARAEGVPCARGHYSSVAPSPAHGAPAAALILLFACRNTNFGACCDPGGRSRATLEHAPAAFWHSWWLCRSGQGAAVPPVPASWQRGCRRMRVSELPAGSRLVLLIPGVALNFVLGNVGTKVLVAAPGAPLLPAGCPPAVSPTPGPFLSLPGGWHGEQGVSFLPRALPTWLCPHIPSVKGLGTGGAPTWGAGLGAGGPGGAPASAILGWKSAPEPGLVPMGPPVSRWCCRPGSEVL